MADEGPRVALEDNDDGKGQAASENAAEGAEQTDKAKAEEGKKSGWGRGTLHPILSPSAC